ncbi:MAG: RNA recognition motif domain-containing protein [Nitrospiraceae bacterium]
MAARVYVGNLPFTVDAEQLRALVEQGGHKALDIKVVTDRDTGRPRGFAFVEMASAEEAQAVISALNGRDVGGRTLTVSMAREREPRGGGPGRGGFGRDRTGGGGGRRQRY